KMRKKEDAEEGEPERRTRRPQTYYGPRPRARLSRDPPPGNNRDGCRVGECVAGEGTLSPGRTPSRRGRSSGCSPAEPVAAQATALHGSTSAEYGVPGRRCPPCLTCPSQRLGRWRKEHPMARSTTRPVVKLRSTAGTGVTYVTRKNRLNDPDRLVLRKYDP